MIPAALLAGLALAGPARAAPTRHRLDPAAGRLYVAVTKDPRAPGAALAHDHVVQASTFSGTVAWDPADPAACAVEVEVPVAGLVVDPPALRAALGLPGPLGEGTRRTVDGNMRAPGQLDAARFATIRFMATACRAEGEAVRVEGTFTLRGVTRPVALPVRIEVDGDTLRATGALPLRTSDFGLPPYSAPLGVVRNRDEVAIHLDLVGRAYQ